MQLFSQWRERWNAFLDRAFVPRDLIVRSRDQVQQRHLSVWQQKTFALCLCTFLGLFLASLVGLGWQNSLLNSSQEELAARQIAFLELMEEVNSYQSRFAEMTLALKTEQTALLARLEKDLGAGGKLDLGPLESHAGDQAARWSAMAREDLRAHLTAFEQDLLQLTSYNGALSERVALLGAELNASREETQLIQSVHLDLNRRLEETQQHLTLERQEAEKMVAELGALRAQLADSHKSEEVLKTANVSLTSDLEESQKVVQVQRAESQAQALEITALSNKLIELEDSLFDQEARASDLELLLLATQEELAGAERFNDLVSQDLATQEAVAKERFIALKDRDQQIETLTQTLAQEESKHRELLAAKARLESDLSQRETTLATLVRERDTLQNSKKTLESRLLAEQKSMVENGLQMAALHQSRESILAEKVDIESQHGALTKQVQHLKSRLEYVDKGQLEIIKRYREQANETMGSVARTIEIAGLDMDQMIAIEPREDEQVTAVNAQGGPFVASLSATLGAGDNVTELERSLSALEQELERWGKMQSLLRSLPLAAPLEEFDITSSFGYRRDPINGRKARHEGLDFAAPKKTSVYATAPGKVVFAGWKGHYGRMVEVDHGHGLRTRYAHLRSILVRRGDELGNRQKIGLVGSSGRSTGAHLHYEILHNRKPMDPMNFLLAGKTVFKE